jgi:Raf kinase inhibitor-like YbhB/YbcL family protein
VRLESPAFSAGSALPRRQAADGLDLSPALSIADVPKSTRELALVCEDPDAPGGWTHWLLYGLRPETSALPEGLPRRQFACGARQGLNNWGALGWGGPFPPRGESHLYVFTLSALSRPLGLDPGASLARLKGALEGLVLDRATLAGVYRR